jgi:hypothetical protein
LVIQRPFSPQPGCDPESGVDRDCGIYDWAFDWKRGEMIDIKAIEESFTIRKYVAEEPK